MMKAQKNTYEWIVVILLLLVWMLNYLDRQVIFSIFPLLQGELHISAFEYSSGNSVSLGLRCMQSVGGASGRSIR